MNWITNLLLIFYCLDSSNKCNSGKKVVKNSFFRAGRDFIRKVINKKSIIPYLAKIIIQLNKGFVTILEQHYAKYCQNILKNKSFVT